MLIREQTLRNLIKKELIKETFSPFLLFLKGAISPAHAPTLETTAEDILAEESISDIYAELLINFTPAGVFYDIKAIADALDNDDIGSAAKALFFLPVNRVKRLQKLASFGKVQQRLGKENYNNFKKLIKDSTSNIKSKKIKSFGANKSTKSFIKYTPKEFDTIMTKTLRRQTLFNIEEVFKKFGDIILSSSSKSQIQKIYNSTKEFIASADLDFLSFYEFNMSLKKIVKAAIITNRYRPKKWIWAYSTDFDQGGIKSSGIFYDTEKFIYEKKMSPHSEVSHALKHLDNYEYGKGEIDKLSEKFRDLVAEFYKDISAAHQVRLNPTKGGVISVAGVTGSLDKIIKKVGEKEARLDKKNPIAEYDESNKKYWKNSFKKTGDYYNDFFELEGYNPNSKYSKKLFELINAAKSAYMNSWYPLVSTSDKEKRIDDTSTEFPYDFIRSKNLDRQGELYAMTVEIPEDAKELDRYQNIKPGNYITSVMANSKTPRENAKSPKRSPKTFVNLNPRRPIKK